MKDFYTNKQAVYKHIAMRHTGTSYARPSEIFDFWGRKYHQTIEEHFTAVIDAGFHVLQVVKPSPDPSEITLRPEMEEDLQRPLFLGMRFSKGVVLCV